MSSSFSRFYPAATELRFVRSFVFFIEKTQTFGSFVGVVIVDVVTSLLLNFRHDLCILSTGRRLTRSDMLCTERQTKFTHQTAFKSRWWFVLLPMKLEKLVFGRVRYARSFKRFPDHHRQWIVPPLPFHADHRAFWAFKPFEQTATTFHIKSSVFYSGHFFVLPSSHKGPCLQWIRYFPFSVSLFVFLLLFIYSPFPFALGWFCRCFGFSVQSHFLCGVCMLIFVCLLFFFCGFFYF